MADSIQVSHHDALSGSGADNIGTTNSAAVHPSNPFSSTIPASNSQPYSLHTAEYPASNPFIASSQAQQDSPQEPTASLPQLPPRPDQSQLRQHEFKEMTSTAHLAPHDANPAVVSPETPGEDHEQSEEQVTDTQEISNLKAMFPDFDSAVLLSVLQSVNHDQDRAIDMLLSMSDPNYVSTQLTAPNAGDSEDPATALALDEQLARQLALEDEQEAERRHARHRSGAAGQPARATGQNWSRRGPGSPPQEGEKVVFQQEIQETVSRLAESGKRTFSSLVSRVKAKISEMDQNRNAQSQSSSSAQSNPYENPQSGSNAPIDRHAASEAFAHEYYGETKNATSAGPPAASGWISAAQEVQGYDVGEQAIGRTTTQPGGVQPPSVASSPGNEVPRPPATGSGSPIDAAKLGILPKRPVSLLGSQPVSQGASSPTSPRRDPEDDDLEYMENPFEEGRK